jgi:hypothetical protein
VLAVPCEVYQLTVMSDSSVLQHSVELSTRAKELARALSRAHDPEFARLLPHCFYCPKRDGGPWQKATYLRARNLCASSQPPDLSTTRRRRLPNHASVDR